jgi:chemotaxis protein MotB
MTPLSTQLRRAQKYEPEDDGWLITFADMAVLLMCFFVLMFAMSSPDKAQFDLISKALMDEGFSSRQDVPTDDPYEKLKSQLATALNAQGFGKDMVVDASHRSIEVELAAGAFFQSGTAKFSAKALPMLKVMSDQLMPLADKDVVIEVDGHTDDAPVANEQFPSNWELSSARASNLVRYFITQGFPANKLRAVGLADTQPKAPNRDAKGNPIAVNQELNRRMVMKMLKGDDR